MFPLIDIHIIYITILKLICGLLMCLILSPKFQIKKFIGLLFCFLGVTFCIGGASVGLMYLTGNNLNNIFNLNLLDFPLGVLISAIMLGIFFAARTFFIQIRKNEIKPFLRTLEIFYRGKSISVNGLIDTGNNLYDPDNNLPVVVVNQNAFVRLLPDEFILQAVKADKKLRKDTKYIRFSTATDSSLMLIIKPDKILIYSGGKVNTIYDVMLGLSKRRLGGQTYEALIHPALI